MNRPSVLMPSLAQRTNGMTPSQSCVTIQHWLGVVCWRLVVCWLEARWYDQGQPPTWQGEEMPFNHFSDPRDIALGVLTDGFAPHKRRMKTCWPVVGFNYNLPPDVRFHQENIIPLGTIPRPKKPQDFDSFILLQHGTDSYIMQT
jgi:hypothetical protein